MGYKNLKKNVVFLLQPSDYHGFQDSRYEGEHNYNRAKDDAADLTENEDAVETSNTKNEETIHA